MTENVSLTCSTPPQWRERRLLSLSHCRPPVVPSGAGKKDGKIGGKTHSSPRPSSFCLLLRSAFSGRGQREVDLADCLNDVFDVLLGVVGIEDHAGGASEDVDGSRAALSAVLDRLPFGRVERRPGWMDGLLAFDRLSDGKDDRAGWRRGGGRLRPTWRGGTCRVLGFAVPR